MINLVKFLGKLILPFIIPYIFLSVVQGLQFNMINWSGDVYGFYATMSFIFFVLTCIYIVNENT